MDRERLLAEKYEYGLFAICVLLLLNLIAIAIKRLQPANTNDVPTTFKQARFRKRDKVIFYGRKMLRKVRSSFQKSGNHRIFRLNHYLHPEFVSLRPTTNFSNVCIIGASDDVPLEAFCVELNQALTSLRTVLTLSADYIRDVLGPRAFDVSNEAKLTAWLKEQRDSYRLIIYQCDRTFTTWSNRCIRSADCILVVGLANSPPTVGRVEKQLDSIAVNTQKELVLLHSNPLKPPENTVLWLNMRAWCSWHHHIRCPKRMFIKKSPVKMREYYNIVASDQIDIHSDLSRLARCLTGSSVGLVLGGGGARGSAHAGMIKAILEAGIPIDMIGGVSIGAFMGALYSQEGDYIKFLSKARRWSSEMVSYWRQILDLTYPVTAMFTGAAFNRTICNVFGEKQLEDLWLPFFCITTDISSSRMRIHRYGSLWRYVRSSMSLSGYLPPLCDPVDGHLLLDGGYVNNLPADVMKEVMGAHTILAVDVGSQDETDLYNYGDTLSGWWLLWKRWNPWATPVKVPSLPEIQSRLAFVSCVRQLERVKNSSYCTYIRPPIDKFKSFQFGSFDEISEVGYQHGSNFFTDDRFDSLKCILNNHRTLTCFAMDREKEKENLWTLKELNLPS